MTNLLTLIGLAFCAPLSVYVTAWSLGKALLDIEAHRSEQDIARILAGLHPDEPEPEPVEEEPLRHIAWEIADEEAEAALRAFRWATGELERIHAEIDRLPLRSAVPAGAA